MEIILVLFVLALVILALLTLYTFIKWVSRTKTRAMSVLISFLSVVIGLGIYQLFFVKLKFIQSKVYPDLFLVKNFPEDRSVLNQNIKDFVIKRIKTRTQKLQLDSNISLRFYQYSKSYNPLVFGDSGTAYFIDNEEDLTGMVVEDLSMYITLKLAVLNQTICVDKNRFCAKLDFYKEGKMVKTDILINTYPSIHEHISDP